MPRDEISFTLLAETIQRDYVEKHFATYKEMQIENELIEFFEKQFEDAMEARREAERIVRSRVQKVEGWKRVVADVIAFSVARLTQLRGTLFHWRALAVENRIITDSIRTYQVAIDRLESVRRRSSNGSTTKARNFQG